MRFRSRAAVAAVVALACASHALGAITYRDLYSLGRPAGVNSTSPSGYTVASGGQVIGFGNLTTTGNAVALLWTAAAPSGINLHPASFSRSLVRGTNGSQQVGYGQVSSSSNDEHAFLWNGTASSIVDLHPLSGFTRTEAFGTSGTQQVGVGDGAATGGSRHALLWSGTAASMIDLHPLSGFLNSNAVATDGTRQVGGGLDTANSRSRALLWTGSRASAVDLHPAALFTNSFAYGVEENRQVGFAYSAGTQPEAVLWTGSAESVVRLNPVGFTTSYALDVSAIGEVGYGSGSTTNGNHALFWSHTAASYVDLHRLLPSSFVSSEAHSIVGTTIYGVGFESNGTYHAISWTVPEPTALASLVLAGPCVWRRRRGR